MQIKEIILKTTLDMEKDLGSLEVFVEATAEEDEQGTVFLWAQLVDSEKREADRIFPMELEKQTQFCMEVENPCLWNTEHPYLYELILELRDEENRLLGCTTKMIGFYHIQVEEEHLLLNGKKMQWRKSDQELQLALKLERGISEEELQQYLSELKRQYCNCLYLPEHLCSPDVKDLCVGCGILLLNDEQKGYAQQKQLSTFEGAENPDFEMQVVEDGVLIENKSKFVNTNVYALRCEIFGEYRILQQSVVEADVPAGSSRYVELPFIKPQNPGMYRYRVSLCLKKDSMWEKKGYAVASSETMISNLWLG